MKGAVVVRRPGLTNVSDNIAPAHTLDFVTTLQSYFAIFSAALLPTYGKSRCNNYRQQLRGTRFCKTMFRCCWRCSWAHMVGIIMPSVAVRKETPKVPNNGSFVVQ